MPYRLYVDEVGNDDLTHVDDDRYRYLSLTGVAMHHNHARNVATPSLNALKLQIFHGDPDEPVNLHRKDIVNRRGPFIVLNDEATHEDFNRLILDFISNTEYAVITALLDKKGMLNQRHWANKHPYHYLMEILTEKYAQFLERKNDVGDIMPEQRRGIKDKQLQDAFSEVLADGTHFVDPGRIKARLTAKQLKFRDKKANITGLQLCDLIAHPSHMFIRQRMRHPVALGPFAQHITPILERHKYDRSPFNGQIAGYGIKYLP